jgi:thioredoxin 2
MEASHTGPRATIACPFCGRLNRVDLGRAADRPLCGDCGRPLLLDRPLTATDANLERIVADAEVPVLVDFYADWCAPCKAMAPMLDEIARSRMGRALVLKVDTDRNPQAGSRYEIRAIPTLVLFDGGREVQRQVGGIGRRELESMVDGAGA